MEAVEIIGTDPDETSLREADLAQALEVSRQTVNAIETGKHDPSLPLAFRLARLFGLSIEDIFQDQDGPPLGSLTVRVAGFMCAVDDLLGRAFGPRQLPLFSRPQERA